MPLPQKAPIAFTQPHPQNSKTGPPTGQSPSETRLCTHVPAATTCTVPSEGPKPRQIAVNVRFQGRGGCRVGRISQSSLSSTFGDCVLGAWNTTWDSLAMVRTGSLWLPQGHLARCTVYENQFDFQRMGITVAEDVSAAPDTGDERLQITVDLFPKTKAGPAACPYAAVKVTMGAANTSGTNAGVLNGASTVLKSRTSHCDDTART